jgi:hypothetical protein
MAIVVHAHANVDFNRPYGSREARIFLEQLLPETPDITVVLAHMAGAGNFDKSAQQASAVYADAITGHDPRVRNLYFDACISATAAEALCSRSASAKSESRASSTVATLPSKVTFQPTLSRAGTSSLSLKKSLAPSKRTSPRSYSPIRAMGVEGCRVYLWSGAGPAPRIRRSGKVLPRRPDGRRLGEWWGPVARRIAQWGRGAVGSLHEFYIPLGVRQDAGKLFVLSTYYACPCGRDRSPIAALLFAEVQGKFRPVGRRGRLFHPSSSG